MEREYVDPRVCEEVTIQKFRKLPWLRGIRETYEIPEYFLVGIFNPKLWPEVGIQLKEDDFDLYLLLLDSIGVPKGIKEQLSGEEFDYKKGEEYFDQIDIPEELIIEILVRNNPYELKDLSKVSKQFEDMLSRKDVLNKISSRWDLPRSSSISNLADIWKVSNIVEVDEEDEKYFLRGEILIHYLMKGDEDKFIEVLDQTTVLFSSLIRKLTLLAIVMKRRKAYFHLLNKEKDYWYPDYQWSQKTVDLITMEEYYDEEFLRQVFTGFSDGNRVMEETELLRLARYMISNKEVIPKRIFRVLSEICPPNYIERMSTYSKKEVSPLRQKTRKELVRQFVCEIIKIQ